MLINLTYACKMGCNHCLSDCKPDGENMSISTLKDVLNFLTKYGIPTWCFSGGEIFEHPNILAMLDIIEEEWLKAGKFSALLFITNGCELVRNKEVFSHVETLVKKYGKKSIYIQVTNDPRFYPDKLTEKELYWLNKIASTIDHLVGLSNDKDRCLYPQGRALENYSEKNWNTIGPKCTNVRLLAKHGFHLNGISMTLYLKGKNCTPAIAPNGDIKLGESALCPPVASIYDEEKVILNKMKNFHCKQCTIAWEKLKENGPEIYQILNQL